MALISSMFFLISAQRHDLYINVGSKRKKERAMIEFEKLFKESNGQPINYNGDIIFMMDKIDAKINDQFLVTIEKTDSNYLQGIGFSENVSVFGDTVKRAAVYEHFSVPPDERQRTKSKLPFSFTVTCKNKKRTHFNFIIWQWWTKFNIGGTMDLL